MTRAQNAHLAGFAFLFYIAVGVAQSIVGSGASAGTDISARLASLASHATQVRINALLGFATAITALALAAALYGLTRDDDQDLAILATSCRICEGLFGALPTVLSLTLLSLALSESANSSAAAAVAASLFRARTLVTLVGSIFFAIGSTIFSYLFLKGTFIPRGLAWLGIGSSLLLVVALPFELVGLLTGSLAQLIWVPAAAFEIPLGIWLLARGGSHRSAMAHNNNR
jgi:uncharacterized protein DUF4386